MATLSLGMSRQAIIGIRKLAIDAKAKDEAEVIGWAIAVYEALWKMQREGQVSVVMEDWEIRTIPLKPLPRPK